MNSQPSSIWLQPGTPNPRTSRTWHRSAKSSQLRTTNPRTCNKYNESVLSLEPSNQYNQLQLTRSRDKFTTSAYVPKTRALGLLALQRKTTRGNEYRKNLQPGPTYPRPGLLDSWPHKGKQHVEMDTGEFAQTYDRTNNIERTPGLLAVEREWQWLTTCGTC